MRRLFLDFDGVLHPLGLQVQPGRFVNGKPVVSVKVEFFCWAPLLQSMLRDHPDVKIVVSSSWRDSHDVAQLAAYLGPLADRVIDATPPDCPKLESIERWLAEHPEVTSWRALDDAQAEFIRDDELAPELVVCDYQTGIACEKVQASLKQWLDDSRPG